MRTEPKNKEDQGESAILEFVDGPRDSRFMLTAMAVARDRARQEEHKEWTLHNVEKVTRLRKDGVDEFASMVDRMAKLGVGGKWEAQVKSRALGVSEMIKY